MNQPDLYMQNAARPGFSRCLFSAHLNISSDDILSDAKSEHESADSHPIVLCIDRPDTDRNASGKNTHANREVTVDVVTDTFNAAIALADQDPLLQCVSSWLQQDLDWRPMLLDTPVSLDLTLSSAESSAHKIGLALGPMAQSLPSFPAELGGIVKLQRHEQSLHVCLAQLSLSEEDQQRVQPGGCIVLPDTFKVGCTVDLIDMQSKISLAGVYLDRVQNQLSQAKNISLKGRRSSKPTAGVVADGSTPVGLTRIVLEQPITVDMAHWFAQTDEPAAQIQLTSMAGQAVVVEVHSAEGLRIFNAQLIEIGSGLAAVLDGTQ